MFEDLNPPDWSQFDPNMVVNLSDLQYYYENFTDVVNGQTITNKLALTTMDGRVTKLEQEIPGGGGGTGAFLNLGGVPERYPTAEEMVAGGAETGFVVVARQDGIYFYNPVTKAMIKPKKGGGSLAVHGQLPMIFDESHSHQHDGRTGMSGIFTAKCSDAGLTQWPADSVCKLLVVATDKEEHQTALHPSGSASRTFLEGEMDKAWSYHATGGGGGGTPVESAYISQNKISSRPLITAASVGATSIATSPVIVVNAALLRNVNMASIVPHNTETLTTSQVREGRLTTITNVGSANLSLKVPSGHMFHVRGSMDSTNIVIPPKTTYVFNPGIIDNGSGVDVGCWIVVGQYATEASSLGELVTQIEALTLRLQITEEGIEMFHDLRRALPLGNTLVNYNGLGSVIVPASTNITPEQIAGSPWAISTGTTAGRTFTMPDMVPHTGGILTATQVRSGRLTCLVNLSTQTRSVLLTGGCKFNINGSVGTVTQTIQPKTAWLFTPFHNSTTDKIWVLSGVMNLDPSAWKSLSDKVTALEARPLPKNTFKDLTDTPNTYTPGKILGYNLAGTAVVAYDPLDEFTRMTDTPAAYTGHARKLVGVKPDEKGLEFVNGPDTSGMQTDIDNLVNDGLQTKGELYVINQKVSALEGGTMSERQLFGKSLVATASTSRESVGLVDMVIFTGTANNSLIRLPQIMPIDTGKVLLDYQARCGKTYTFMNSSSVDMKLNIRPGDKFWIKGVESTTDQVVKPGITSYWRCDYIADVPVWVYLGKLDNSTV